MSAGTTPVIRIQGLGKEYVLGATTPGSGSLREALGSLATAPVRRLRSLSGRAREDERFWALRDVNLDVAAGEVVGIIGRNGAGKSTLLKILSRITAPTTGRATITGRVASLLEVGTGFHPELTGRENIFLNGAILGMTRRDIRARFDDIVAFAELENFLETPVKRYSSGMYVRLAFAVAAHLDTDVLIVDEVLAVGDAAFQRKCLGTMESVAGSGRTVLFVSHNMNAVRRLCVRGVYLDAGRLRFDGMVDAAVAHYLRDHHASEAGEAAAGPEHRHLQQARLEDAGGRTSALVGYEETSRVRVLYTAPRAPRTFVLALRVTDELGNVLFTSWDTDSLDRDAVTPGSPAEETCTLPATLLRPGRYTVTVLLRVREHGVFVHDESLDLGLEISEVGIEAGRARLGLIAPRLRWTLEHRTGP